MTKEPSLTKPLLVLGVIVTICALIFFVGFVLRYIGEMPTLEWNLITIITCVGGIAVYLLAMLIGAYTWHLFVLGAGGEPQWVESFVIFFLAQFAKYIPGNFSHHIGRVALAGTYGLEPVLVGFTMVLEIGWALIASALLAIVSLMVAGPRIFSGVQFIPEIWQLALIILAAIMIPLLLSWVLRRWRPAPLRRLLGENQTRLPGKRLLMATLLLFVINFIFSGSIIEILAHGLFQTPGNILWITAGIYAVAWIAGFITPGAPAGLGVRDAILVAALTAIYGAGIAVGITISLRVLATLGDGIAFLVGLGTRRVHSRKQASLAL